MLQRFDLYAQVHKGLRMALSELCHQAGSTDSTDVERVNAFIEDFKKVVIILEAHSRDEDANINESYEKYAPEVLKRLEEEHNVLDQKLEELTALIERFEASEQPMERNTIWFQIGKDLNRFSADYLSHLQTEEGAGMQALWEHVTDEELKVISKNIRSSIPPQTMAIFMHYMIPSISHNDRVEMFGEMKQFAPKEAFAGMLGLAENRLDESSWKRLQAALSLSEQVLS